MHPSNYRVVGFTASAPAKDLAALARKHDVPFLYDVGSGLLVARPRDAAGRARRVTDALADGADLVTFSGDKLLGGPQAGMVVGQGRR